MSKDDDHANRRKDRRDAGRALLVGVVLALLGGAFMFSPLIWNRSFPLSKYVVACGLALAFVGAGMILNGGIDWLRSNR